ncbi:hypothetical protein DAPPUDRAFT_306863 [Daphnia pulex]|uniref:Uncharacterized protein n=1 Tax=Daphnia pulex TaxID=6669 RepID=E9I572_DAPPU|nr:hypothetical protein DAPPUDRAFT_306863 [Daphnia pulex]|eukprot:EFX60858.1 hypothetical protein DAPPUDRAFT_306863 [Daphnia pulex]
MEAAEPVALPCVTTEDMFQEPTTETLLHIPPEKELQSESESQLRVEFEPNDMESVKKQLFVRRLICQTISLQSSTQLFAIEED